MNSTLFKETFVLDAEITSAPQLREHFLNVLSLRRKQPKMQPDVVLRSSDPGAVVQQLADEAATWANEFRTAVAALEAAPSDVNIRIDGKDRNGERLAQALRAEDKRILQYKG